MRLNQIILIAAVWVRLLSLTAMADVVELKGGQKLIGDIVAEKHGRLYVDIGVTVVAVPKDDV